MTLALPLYFYSKDLYTFVYSTDLFILLSTVVGVEEINTSKMRLRFSGLFLSSRIDVTDV